MMEKLQQLKLKISEFKGNNVNEAQTKEWFVKPFFEILGWNFSDPSEVVPEDDDLAGKKTDYCFYFNNEKKLLVEAKPLNNKLDDEKMIIEKINYTANSGVPLLIITNGDLYKIFYSELKGVGKEKLLTEFSISETIEDYIIELLKKESFRENKLLNYAKYISVLSNVKKALESLISSNDKKFIKLINEKIKFMLGHKFGEDDIKDALKSISIQITSDFNLDYDEYKKEEIEIYDKTEYTVDDQFKNGKWSDSKNLFINLIEKLKNEGMDFEILPTKKYINLSKSGKSFAQVGGLKSGIKIWLNLNYSDLSEEEKLKTRDVSKIGHWGMGDVECFVNNQSDIERAINLINKSYRKTFEI